MNRTALITGSFDPITIGHMHLIRTAAAMFDSVYVTICANTEKASGMFLPEQRKLIAAKALEAEELSNVQVVVWSGLVSDAALKYGAKYLVRGLRNVSDFDYEYGLAAIMKRFDPALETVLIPTDPSLAYISATYVRDLLKYGCSLEGAVPAGCSALIRDLYKQR